MIKKLEDVESADYDGTGTDVSQIFHEDDPTFVGPPQPTKPTNVELVKYSGRFSADHVYVTGRFMDSYQP